MIKKNILHNLLFLLVSTGILQATQVDTKHTDNKIDNTKQAKSVEIQDGIYYIFSDKTKEYDELVVFYKEKEHLKAIKNKANKQEIPFDVYPYFEFKKKKNGYDIFVGNNSEYRLISLLDVGMVSCLKRKQNKKESKNLKDNSNNTNQENNTELEQDEKKKFQELINKVITKEKLGDDEKLWLMQHVGKMYQATEDEHTFNLLLEQIVNLTFQINKSNQTNKVYLTDKESKKIQDTRSTIGKDLILTPCQFSTIKEGIYYFVLKRNSDSNNILIYDKKQGLHPWTKKENDSLEGVSCFFLVQYAKNPSNNNTNKDTSQWFTIQPHKTNQYFYYDYNNKQQVQLHTTKSTKFRFARCRNEEHNQYVGHLVNEQSETLQSAPLLGGTFMMVFQSTLFKSN